MLRGVLGLRQVARVGPHSVGTYASSRRAFAQAGPALVLVDGQQSTDLVRAQLSLRLAANPQGVHVITAGRQGITITLRALAQLHKDGRSPAFHMCKADGKELHDAGLSLPGGGMRVAGEDAGEEDSASGEGFRLALLPMREGAETREALRKLVLSRVLRVKGGYGQIIPLAKSVATEVARAPEQHACAIETLMRGKSKNLWTRIYRLASAVTQAHEWQVKPKSEKVHRRRFRCVVEERASDDEQALEQHRAQAKEEGREAEELKVLRLLLVPEEPPQPGRARVATAA